MSDVKPSGTMFPEKCCKCDREAFLYLPEWQPDGTLKTHKGYCTEHMPKKYLKYVERGHE